MIADFRGTDRRCVVYRSGDETEIETWLGGHGVAVEARPLPPDGPGPFIEIHDGGEFVGIIGVDAVEGLTEPPIVRPGEGGETSEAYRVLFELLEETVLSGMTRRELLAVSREIEDRAFRAGEGTLRVSFQNLSTFESQVDAYRSLGAETDLDVHVHGVEDWTPPTIPGVTFHVEGAERIEPYWALAYDGGGDEARACGLVADDRSDGYAGFWTDDPEVVGEIASALVTA